VVWLRDEATLVWDEGGEPLYWLGVQTDVTERKEAEEASRKSQAGLAEAQRMVHLGSWDWDPRSGGLDWSDETFRIYGFEPQSFVPTFERLLEVVHPDDRKTLVRGLEETLREDRPYDLEHRVVKPDGQVRVVHRQAAVVRDESGEPIRMVGTVQDITERKALEQQLEHRAFHDSLTNLPNRQLFVDRLGQALRRTRRSKKRSVAVLFMDLDGFKVVNDSLGHEAGDLLLVAVAERLKGCLRPEDTLAQFGGDEFVVLLENAEGLDDSVRVAERIIDELGEAFTIEGRELYARASIGIALGGGGTKGPDDLLRDADTAMYRAKDEGSGYAVFDPAMYERAINRLQSENDLKGAIEREEFVVHYQPIVNLRTGQVSTVEALVRWEHPEWGLLNADEFVPIAEESGLVIPMGEQVLREACLRANQWQEGNPRTPPLVVSVNLSAGQLSRPGLAETVEAILQETGLEGSRLTLDVTETVYVKALEGSTTDLDRLRRLGVKFSIDDFGMGYSSLSYLKRLPADALKIDKSFVWGLEEDGADTAIVRMIIELAHTLGMEVVAEGVETREQAALLKEMGCDLGQGFHFSKALPPEDLSELLTRAS
jgi:diguanylate cyclase (GGDEF)-like protein/PAS domain S-box-containing protein